MGYGIIWCRQELNHNNATRKEDQKMTKEELVTKLADMAGTTKKAANTIVDGLVAEITRALSKGDRIVLPGLGTFSVVKRAKRKGRNPQTGEEITIPASKVAKFKAAPKLKDAINKKR